MQGDQYWTVQNKRRKKRKNTPRNKEQHPFQKHNKESIHAQYYTLILHEICTAPHQQTKNTKQLTPCPWRRCWPWYAHEAGEGQNPTATPLPALRVRSEDLMPAVSCSARLSHTQHRSSCEMKYGDGWTSPTRIRQQATIYVHTETVQITTHLDSTIFKQGISKGLVTVGEAGGGGGGYAKSEWDHQ